ncbi:uncharacterized protein LOC131679476 [Topomyia yanbarensis]|uniref:uncharacterized protein LOC131679476 n=1 Tax=Topomyia yanbarensis TaxID=2498891 RepID=UPI00273C70B7|nr:uncharacterized protein LOC131679476 [Topomyia yanbarensis]
MQQQLTPTSPLTPTPSDEPPTRPIKMTAPPPSSTAATQRPTKTLTNTTTGQPRAPGRHPNGSPRERPSGTTPPNNTDPSPHPMRSQEEQSICPHTKYRTTLAPTGRNNRQSEIDSSLVRENAFSLVPALSGEVPAIADAPPAAAGTGDPTPSRATTNILHLREEAYVTQRTPTATNQ